MSFIPKYNAQSNNQNNNSSLQNEIEKLKREILRLNDENTLLKNENKRLKNDNQYLNNQIGVKDQNLNIYLSKINELNNTLNNKNNEIADLNNKMENLKLNNNSNYEYVRRNEMLSIQFKSIDQKVDISYSCKNTDLFVRIEEMLYNEYPEYKDLNTYFTVGGHVVKRFRNLLENNIKDKDKILLNVYQ